MTSSYLLKSLRTLDQARKDQLVSEVAKAGLRLYPHVLETVRFESGMVIIPLKAPQ